MAHHSTQEWAEKNFGTALLFNKKKTQRLVIIATRLSEAKGTSLARLFNNWYDTVVHVWDETAKGEKIEWFLYTDLEAP